MITFHHLNNSRLQPILWLLEELGADYQVVAYRRDATSNLAPLELKAAHPLGKSPLIEDEGLRVAESGAIIQYLFERHDGPGWLPDPASEDHVRHLEWMQCGESSFFCTRHAQDHGRSPRRCRGADHAAHRRPARFRHRLRRRHHRRQPSLCRDQLDRPDVMMSFPAEIPVMQGCGAKAPKLAAFVEKVHARPTCQRARERGGPYFGW